MSSVLAFLTNRFVLAVGSGLALLAAVTMLFFWMGEKAAKRTAEAQAAELHKAIEEPVKGWRARLGTCEASLTNVTTSLERQNAAVEQMQVDGDALKRRADAAVAAAQGRAKAFQAKAEQIARAKPTGEVCASARTLIVDVLAEERQ